MAAAFSALDGGRSSSDGGSRPQCYSPTDLGGAGDDEEEEVELVGARTFEEKNAAGFASAILIDSDDDDEPAPAATAGKPDNQGDDGCDECDDVQALRAALSAERAKCTALETQLQEWKQRSQDAERRIEAAEAKQRMAEEARSTLQRRIKRAREAIEGTDVE